MVEEFNDNLGSNVVNTQPTRTAMPQYTQQPGNSLVPYGANNGGGQMQRGPGGGISLGTQEQMYGFVSQDGQTAGVMQVQRNLEMNIDLNAYVASVLYDKSGSMAGQRDSTALAGLLRVVQHFTEADLLNVIAFNDRAFEVSDFQASAGAGGKVRALQRLASVRASGSTSLYDAIAMATLGLVQLWPLLNASNQGTRLKHKCMIIVLTDGEDTSSQVKLPQCIELIQKIVALVGHGNCRFIFIGIDLDAKGSSALQQLQRAGGQSAEFYNSRNMDLDSIFDRLAASFSINTTVNVAAVRR